MDLLKLYFFPTVLINPFPLPFRVLAGLSLAAYGAGLLGHMLVKVLAPGYFARQDTRTPVRYGVIALVSNIVLNLALVWQFKHAGLALATSLSAFINATLLFLGLRRDGVLVLTPGWLKFLMQITFAVAVMVVCLTLIMPSMDLWLTEGLFIRLGYMILICLAGAVTYSAALLLTGVNIRQLVR